MPTSRSLCSSCPVCALELAAPVAEFPFNDYRAPGTTVLHGCINCGSAHFKHPSRDFSSLNWHRKVFDRNTRWSEDLYAALAPRAELRSVIDIGCGIGTWLKYAESRGSTCLGYDTGADSVEYGIRELGMQLRPRPFVSKDPDAVSAKATLLTCIMVLEHLSEPRALVQEIAQYCRQMGAKVYISVPFLNNYGFLKFDDSLADYNVFNDVGGHVTYYTDRSMIRMFGDFGLTHEATLFPASWRGMLFRP
jgi:SAM-dependent methyltransferase